MPKTVKIMNISSRTFQFGVGGNAQGLGPKEVGEFDAAIAEKLLADYPGELESEKSAVKSFASSDLQDFTSGQDPEQANKPASNPDAEREAKAKADAEFNEKIEYLKEKHGADVAETSDVDGKTFVVLRKGKKEITSGILDELVGQ